MLGPIGSVVANIMRILTPHDIEKLTQSAHMRSRKLSAIERVEVGLESSTQGGVSAKQSKSKSLKEQEENDDVLEEQAQSSPKVIPIGRHLERQENKEQGQHSFKQAAGQSFQHDTYKTKGNSALESVGVLSSQKIKEEEERILEQIKSREPSSAVFLLDERRKMERAQKKLYGQSAHKVYREHASLDIKTEEMFDEENKASSSIGILLDKKQF